MTYRMMIVVILTGTSWAAAQTTRPATRPNSPSQMMDQLLQPAASQPRPMVEPPTGEAVDKTSGKAAVAPSALPVIVMREGTYVFDRMGRLGRTPDGSQAQFIFESDGKALKDPPLIILPNLKLVMMEDTVKGANRDLPFRVTGFVTEYRGRNYLLLEKVLVMNDTARQF